MEKDSIGNRMKKYYEDRYRIYLTRRVPVIIRVDGRAFHSMDLDKPFDAEFIAAMRFAAVSTSLEMQGFKMGYIQSDEASFLLTDFDKLETEAWFDYNLSKLTSISAALMSVYFNRAFHRSVGIFDARAFNVPKEDVPNYFIWRYQDWHRNSVHMYCQSFFSHKELMNKNSYDQHEMLHSIGKNWATDLSSTEKNGAFIFAKDVTSSGDLTRSDFGPDYASILDKVPILKEGVTWRS